MLQPAPLVGEALGEPSAAPSGGYEPHRNFERWQADRAVQKERTDALAAAGVADGSRYSLRPGDEGPVGGDRNSCVAQVRRAAMAGDILNRPFVPLEPAALQAENERLKAEVLVLREQL